jgi:hypothetical protein
MLVDMAVFNLGDEVYALYHDSEDDSRLVKDSQDESIYGIDYSLKVTDAQGVKVGSAYCSEEGWVFTDLLLNREVFTKEKSTVRAEVNFIKHLLREKKTEKEYLK